MLFVIKNRDTGKYVARLGSTRSYTTKISETRIFETNKAAQRERCGNEIVENLRPTG